MRHKKVKNSNSISLLTYMLSGVGIGIVLSIFTGRFRG